jgi:hypothetical protein
MAEAMKKRMREQLAEHEEQTAARWPAFRDRLAQAQTMAEARALVGDTPKPDAPGRTFYSNLDFFLQSFTIPGGSNSEERALYLAFVRRLEAAGVLKPGVMARLESEFHRVDSEPR